MNRHRLDRLEKAGLTPADFERTIDDRIALASVMIAEVRERGRPTYEDMAPLMVEVLLGIQELWTKAGYVPLIQYGPHAALADVPRPAVPGPDDVFSLAAQEGREPNQRDYVFDKRTNRPIATVGEWALYRLFYENGFWESPK